MRRMLWMTAGIAVLCTGCLRRLAIDETRHVLASRYIHDRPIEEVWPVAVQLLREERYFIRESATSYELVTDWRAETNASAISGSYSRYLVFAERLEADRTLVRFVRVNAVAQGGEPDTLAQAQGRYGLRHMITPSDTAGGAWTRRDLKMEWRLVARLRPDIAAASETEIARRLPQWLNGDPEDASIRSGASKTVVVKTAADVVTAPNAELTDTAESVAPSCEAPLHGEEVITGGARLVLLGELPGTVEVPHFVGQLACRAAKRGGAVEVGLEIPFDEQPRIDAYLSSEGSASDRELLLAGGFWRRAWQDGRSSGAVADLLEQLRRLRASGREVGAFAFDVRGMGGNLRQQELAKRVLAARQRAPEALMLILTGNVQSRVVPGTPWDRELVPMGARLVAQVPDLLALDAHYSGGYAWTCRFAAKTRTECSEDILPAPQRSRILGRGMGSSKVPDERHRHLTYVRVDQAEAGGAHHGIFYLGRLSASPPAIPDEGARTVLR